jgi:mutator protein MutT
VTVPHSPIEVAAALIFREGKLLITRRHAGVHLGGLWEFPGGKREPGEPWQACVIREIREELGVEMVVGTLFADIEHAYPEKTVRLKFFTGTLVQGEPQAIGCADYRWIGLAELNQFAFPAADAQLLEQLKNPHTVWA